MDSDRDQYAPDSRGSDSPRSDEPISASSESSSTSGDETPEHDGTEIGSGNLGVYDQNPQIDTTSPSLSKTGAQYGASVSSQFASAAAASVGSKMPIAKSSVEPIGDEPERIKKVLGKGQGRATSAKVDGIGLVENRNFRNAGKQFAAEESFKEAKESVKNAAISDTPSGEDAYGFTPFVKAITEYLRSPDTQLPITMSIEGEWGSGKSSFLNQLGNRLEAGGAIAIKFDPWRYEMDTREILPAFMSVFVNELKGRLPWYLSFWHSMCLFLETKWGREKDTLIWQAIFGLLISAAFLHVVLLLSGPTAEWLFDHRFSGKWMDLLDVLPYPALVSAGAVYLFALRKRLWASIGNPFLYNLERELLHGQYLEKAAFIDAFHKDFRNMVKSYTPRVLRKTERGLNGFRPRIFVLVDDLDRCEPGKAVEVLRAIKLMLPDQGLDVGFILAIDKGQLIAGIAAQTSDIVPYYMVRDSEYDDKRECVAPGDQIGIKCARLYLEKFIQVPYRLPLSSRKAVDDYINWLCASELPKPNELSIQDAASVKSFMALEGSADSPRVQEIVRMASIPLGNNPRRLKVFLNLFRLKAHIAYLTGLFQFADPGDADKRLTDYLSLEMIGKYVVMCMEWPDLVHDLRYQSDLLTGLHYHAENSPKDEVLRQWKSTALDKWKSESKLLVLISYGTDYSVFKTINYDVSNVNVGKLLSI